MIEECLQRRYVRTDSAGTQRILGSFCRERAAGMVQCSQVLFGPLHLSGRPVRVRGPDASHIQHTGNYNFITDNNNIQQLNLVCKTFTVCNISTYK
jgi:hypothetical protein